MLIFDIETGPRSDDEIRQFCQAFARASVKGIVDGGFDPSKIRGIVTGDFDPSTVKLGALKDQEKIDAKIAEAREKHEASVALGKQKTEEAREEHERAKLDSARLIAEGEQAHWNKFVGRAALSATTGHVLAIGYWSASARHRIQGQCETLDEAALLTNFWNSYRKCRSERRPMIGFYSNKFDVPFMRRRSWLLGVEVPATLFDSTSRYIDKTFVDLAQEWQSGNYQDTISLDELARYFGLQGKPDGISGADFARLWFDDREQAIQYLKNDLDMTRGIAACMGYV